MQVKTSCSFKSLHWTPIQTNWLVPVCFVLCSTCSEDTSFCVAQQGHKQFYMLHLRLRLASYTRDSFRFMSYTFNKTAFVKLVFKLVEFLNSHFRFIEKWSNKYKISSHECKFSVEKNSLEVKL